MEKRLFCEFRWKKIKRFFKLFKEISNKAINWEKIRKFILLFKYFTNSEKEYISKLGNTLNNIQNYEVENIINLNFLGVDISNINLDELKQKFIEIQKFLIKNINLYFDFGIGD